MDNTLPTKKCVCYYISTATIMIMIFILPSFAMRCVAQSVGWCGGRVSPLKFITFFSFKIGVSPPLGKKKKRKKKKFEPKKTLPPRDAADPLAALNRAFFSPKNLKNACKNGW